MNGTSSNVEGIVVIEFRHEEDVRSILSETQTLTLATLDEDGSPRATPLFFAVGNQNDLIFVSDPNSQHCNNLQREPQTAVGIYPEVGNWRQIRGLQMKGVASLIPEPQRPAAYALFAARFSFISELSDIVRQSVFFRFRPSWIRLIDNRRGFGFQKEWGGAGE
jgi:uncharacterized protein YhbP (UPF0306 family)